MGVSPRLKKMLRVVLASTALVALSNGLFSSSVAQVGENDESSSSVRGHARQLDTESSASADRPTLYTFVDTSSGKRSTRSSSTVTGSSSKLVEKASNELLEEWKKAWSDAGWNPAIITPEDAEKHDLFNEFASLISSIATTSTNKMCGTQQNSFCFLRYLAMATVGGGYMSDYNVFPLPNARCKSSGNPKDNTFITYGLKPADSGDIPFLAYGGTNEWTRMAKNLIDVLKKEVNNNTGVTDGSSDENTIISMDSRKGLTDTAALLALNATKPGIFQSQNDDVLDRAGLLKLNEDEELSSKNCFRANEKWAVYFSYSDVTAAGHRSDVQSSLAFKLLKNWNTECFASSSEEEDNQKDTPETVGEPIAA